MSVRKRLAEIVKAAVRPFKGWTEFFEFLVFLSACVAGVANAHGCGSWLERCCCSCWAGVAGKRSSWRRETLMLNGAISEHWRAGTTSDGGDWNTCARPYALCRSRREGRTRCAVLAGAFLFGHATRWFWLGWCCRNAPEGSCSLLSCFWGGYRFRASGMLQTWTREEPPRWTWELRCPLRAGLLWGRSRAVRDRQRVNAGARASPSWIGGRRRPTCS